MIWLLGSFSLKWEDAKPLARPGMGRGRQAGESASAAGAWTEASPDKHQSNRKMLACAIECVYVCCVVFGDWRGQGCPLSEMRTVKRSRSRDVSPTAKAGSGS